jgi:transcriptional repressor NrdR
MMKCPFCGFADSQVKDSRPSDDALSIKRRRYCLSCGARFTTFERVETRELKVIKRNDEIRPFDMNKLVRSIEVATRKRPVTSEQIDDISSKIFKKLEKYGEGEIQSKIIGQLVMEELANVDEVACVRYASVYMDFGKAADFGRFIANLRKGYTDK